MPLDQARADDTRDWLSRALADLAAAELLLEGDLIEASAFHSQQAVEKAYKAVLTWHDEPVRRTHNLGSLGAQVAALEAGLADAILAATPLTDFAWRYRYPGDAPPLDRDAAAGALATARAACAAVIERLPTETHPR